MIIKSSIPVYVAMNGSRDRDCGSFENPCKYIADVLFNRNKTVKIHLKAYTIIESKYIIPDSIQTDNITRVYNSTSGNRTRTVDFERVQTIHEEVPAIYDLKLPLNLFGSVSFVKYPKDSKHAPVIRSNRPRMFIMRNSQSFQSDGVDFELNHEDSILLDVDSEGFLKKIMIKNSEIIGSGKIAVSLKIYQEIERFTAERIKFKDGTILYIQGIEKAISRNWTISEYFYTNDVTAKYLMKTENVMKGDACNINQVKITNCKDTEYGLYFDTAPCTFKSLVIMETKFKLSAIDARTRRSGKKFAGRSSIGRYLYNLPDYEYDYEKENGNLTMEDIFIVNSTFATAMQFLHVKAIISKRFLIQNSSMEYTFDISNTELEAWNVYVIQNKVFRGVFNNKMGKLFLENLQIKQNGGSNDKRAITFQANLDEKGLLFKLKNTVIDWNENTLTHPPILDIYVGKGVFEVEMVNITSHSKKPVVLTSIEVGKEFEKSSKLNNLTIHCNVNSDSVHVSSETIRGEKIEASCNPCNIGRYTEQDSFLRLKRDYDDDEIKNASTLFSQVKKVEKADFECIQCPIGGNCENGIKSSGNFYGYPGKDKPGSVIFMACPKSYCCTKDECIGISSCRKLRTGKLCGSCINGFQEDFFSDECIETKNCKNITLFWVFYTFSALFASVLFLYMKDIIQYLKRSKTIFQRLGCLKPATEEEPDKKDEVITVGTEKQQGFTISGCFNIVVGFYQIRSLLTIDVGTKYEKSNTYQEDITKFMDLNFNIIQSLCPMREMTAVGIGFVKNQLVVILMLGWALLLLVTYYTFKLVCCCFKTKPNENTTKKTNERFEDAHDDDKKWKKLSQKNLSNRSNNNDNDDDEVKDKETFIPITFAERIGLGMIKIILFGYKNMASFAIIAFHCLEVDGEIVMFTHGSTKCYKNWQIISMIFFGLWVVPFPAALMVSYRMYMWNVISLRKFVMCLIFPFTSIYQKMATRRIRCLNKTGQAEKMVRVYLRENFEEAYRYREGKEYYVFWETWRLYQRLFLAVVTTRAINPVERICYSAPIILFFIFVYWYVKPYKKQYRILHWMEVIGLLGITFTLVNNMFRSFLYVFEIPDEKPVPQSLYVLWIIDTIASPIFVLPFFLVLKPFVLMIFDKCTTAHFHSNSTKKNRKIKDHKKKMEPSTYGPMQTASTCI